jgi:hypothetical protein
MKVIIDTNVFCADYRMTGGTFRVFLQGLARIGAKCCVPEVVWDEVLANHRKSLKDTAAKIEHARSTWKQLTGKVLDVIPPAEDLTAASEEYRSFLSKRFRDEGIALLPYPKVAHQTLVQRALSRRKPFTESGSGYRDSLIWETLLSLRVSEKGIVAFITKNSRDFGLAPNLHQDLLSDLESGKTVELYNALEQFTAARIIPHLERLEDVLRQIEKNTLVQFSLGAWIDKELEGILNENGHGCDFVGLEPGHGDARISVIKERGRITVDDVRLLPPADLLVLANVDLKVEVMVSADEDDCEYYDDVRQFFGGDCSGSPTAWIEQQGNVAFTLTLDHDSFRVQSCEIDEIQGVCVVEINPHKRRDT